MPKGTQKAETSQQLPLLDGLHEVEILKQVIAKDSPFIINLELPQEPDLPELPQGMKENRPSFSKDFRTNLYYL